MTPAEQIILDQIKEIEQSQQNIRLVLTNLRKQIAEAEDYLVEFKINKGRLEEKLSALRARTIDTEMDHQELDIERFKKILPELLLKIK